MSAQVIPRCLPLLVESVTKVSKGNPVVSFDVFKYSDCPCKNESSNNRFVPYKPGNVSFEKPVKSVVMCNTQKQPPEVFLKKRSRPATLLKKRLWYRCFPLNFLRVFKNTFFTEQFGVTASEYSSPCYCLA